ncbi:MAG TPA: hypothetical protein VN455_02190 [Methanotrichaceae archaeon]|nr:hypothetical protein [Methanotrichaceae archaeon]
MVKLTCQNCGFEVDLETPPKRKLVCGQCGAVNNIVWENAGSGDQACGCLLPTGWEWKEPDGFQDTPAGRMWVCPDDAQLLSRLDWITEYGSDPVKVWDWMQHRPIPEGYKRLGKGIQ